ncbi:MAG: UV DNA damage repair endonuclease UvsE [Candidatus Omnitrophica bacterium]|nr:UV DNA damage repair endonuclease UvsE [Candidatus Omnitrophota bacterium]
MIRFGLCCKFETQPIKFYTTTATALLKLEKNVARRKISNLCLKNAESLQKALIYCTQNNIGSFRVNSQILPLKTHPQIGYDVEKLPDGKDIIKAFKKCKSLLLENNLRMTFHPDQFILLSSPNDEVTQRSIADLNYHAQVCEWIGADVINIHGGGAYGNKKKALDQVARNLMRLSKDVRSRLTFENDDKTYTPQDLFLLCKKEGVPFVYDVHHHRCNPDELSEEQSTRMALTTWDREPLFHISSPQKGWEGPHTNKHHDYIDIKDFPKCWRGLNITVEVEAKAKECAVQRLVKSLGQE